MTDALNGLLGEYGIDLDEVEVPNFNIPDDIYEFEITDVYIKNGTSKDPEQVSLVITFSLGDEGKSKDEWFRLPKDASAPTEKELQSLGFYKRRIMDLGFDESEINSVSREDLIGITGTLQVFTKDGYQNIKNVKVVEAGELEEAPEAEAPAAKAPRARAAATAAATEQKAAAAGVRKNPFA